MQIQVAIVEDELEAAQALESCLKRYGEAAGHEFTVARFTDGGAFLRQYRPIYDIIFMDIRMPGLDGMSAAEKLREKDPVTTLVFVTSIAQYAVRGYAVDATDFLVKPVGYATFSMRMRRVMKAVEERRGTSVLVSAEGGSRVIPSSSIYFVEVIDHGITYHTDQGNFTQRGKLGRVEQQLPQTSFFRCSASYLINLRYVTEMDSASVVVAGERIRVSRARKKDLATALAAYMGRGV